jgi:hypothetical protein
MATRGEVAATLAAPEKARWGRDRERPTATARISQPQIRSNWTMPKQRSTNRPALTPDLGRGRRSTRVYCQRYRQPLSGVQFLESHQEEANRNPERVGALVMWNGYARGLWAPEYPWAPTADEWEKQFAEVEQDWGTRNRQVSGREAAPVQLHRAVDRESGVDRAAGRVDVDRDVRVRLLGLEVQELGHDEVCDLLVDRRPEASHKPPPTCRRRASVPPHHRLPRLAKVCVAIYNERGHTTAPSPTQEAARL